jgi:hypothetical protein
MTEVAAAVVVVPPGPLARAEAETARITWNTWLAA